MGERLLDVTASLLKIRPSHIPEEWKETSSKVSHLAPGDTMEFPFSEETEKAYINDFQQGKLKGLIFKLSYRTESQTPNCVLYAMGEGEEALSKALINLKVRMQNQEEIMKAGEALKSSYDPIPEEERDDPVFESLLFQLPSRPILVPLGEDDEIWTKPAASVTWEKKGGEDGK